MRISTVGVGSRFCSYPFYPESYLVRADEEIIMVNCPARSIEALSKYRKGVLDVDIWVITDTSLSSISGLEYVAIKGQEAGVKPMIVAPPAIGQAIALSLAPVFKGPLSNYFDVNTSSGIEIKEKDGNKETLKFIPHTKEKKPRGFSIHFQHGDVFLAGRGIHDPRWIDCYVESSKVITCNIDMDENNWSEKLTKLLQSKPSLFRRMAFTGFKDKKHFDSIKKIPAIFLNQNECLYDSKRSEWVTHKKKPPIAGGLGTERFLDFTPEI